MKKLPEDLYKSDLKMYTHLKKIRDKLWSNDSKSRVSVMVGAGFSRNASKIEPSFEGMALWRDLKAQLIKDLSHHHKIEKKDVLDIAQIYSDEYGRSALDELLKAAIPDDNFEPGSLHTDLLRLPWTDVFTTNYDSLLERAKRNVYEISYQVVYEINDIPSSVQPRIVKLHGSFPANRPFIFTKNDYDNYPAKFSPFVNMVQQSIMETTFVLIGFSGDDPNFTKWTSWVRSNLKDQMPKIYMIGYNEESQKDELQEKGITLIDFKELYKGDSNPYKSMFEDLFDFLSYKKRIEKIKWPHKPGARILSDEYGYNRETYPGWVIMPDEIRKKNSLRFVRSSSDFLMKIDVNKVGKVDINKINDLIWYYDKFLIPLEAVLYKRLNDIVENYKNGKTDLIPIALRLLKEARLKYDLEIFRKYEKILSKLNLSDEDSHKLTYEKILFYLDVNSIKEVIDTLELWDVGIQELDWVIRKACIYTRINQPDKAEVLFEEYLQTVRRLLAIKMDDYRLLSLESIILHKLSQIKVESYDDRLRVLSMKYCDSGKEFTSLLRSIKELNYSYGTKKSLLFDPGKEMISTKFIGGTSFNPIFNESFALIQIIEEFNLYVIDGEQHEMALKNIQVLYPEYSLIKRIQKANQKGIKNLFTREYVYSMGNNEKAVLIKILKNSLLNGTNSAIPNSIALEIYSRIYMILDAETKLEIDDKIINYIEAIKYWDIPTLKVLKDTIYRIFYAKNSDEAKEFVEKVIALNLRSQNYRSNDLYEHSFFEPILVIYNYTEKVKGMKVSVAQLERLLDVLENDNDYSIVEAAFIRLSFLSLAESLDDSYRERFREILKKMDKDKRVGISDFIIVKDIDNFIDGTDVMPNTELDVFIKDEIPIFYRDKSMSDGYGVIQYFRSIQYLFKGLTELDDTKKPDKSYYIQWLEKFYLWWESQKVALLRDVEYVHPMIPIDEILLNLIIAMKNNIWGSIPLDYLREEDKSRALTILTEIFAKEPEKAMLLIPVLERMGIEHQYNLNYTIESLSDRNIEKSKYSVMSLYDYSIFINKKEIDGDFNIIKEELLHILKYGYGENLNEAIQVLIEIVVIDSKLIDDELVPVLISNLNRYLYTLKNDESLIVTQQDFKLLGSYAKLVAVLVKYKPEEIGGSFEEWRSFIQTHKLPEVRSASMHFEQ